MSHIVYDIKYHVVYDIVPSISGPICFHIGPDRKHIGPDIRPDKIQVILIHEHVVAYLMAGSSDMPGGTGPTAGNGSASKDLLYLSCVILIQSGMLGRKLAYGPVA
jgi:hypothetical protein